MWNNRGRLVPFHQLQPDSGLRAASNAQTEETGCFSLIESDFEFKSQGKAPLR